MASTKKILTFRVQVEGVSKEAQEIVKIDQALSALNEERKESQALYKKGKINEEQHLKNLTTIKSKTKDLQVQKSNLNKTERLSAQAFTASAGSMEALRRRTAQLRAEANQLNTSTAEGRRRMTELRKEIIANTKQIRDYDRSISGSKTLVGEYSKGAVQAFKAIAGGIVAAVAVARTFQRLIGGGIKGFAEFSEGQANVQTLLDANNRALGGQTIRLIRDYGLAVADTNKALFDAVSAGVPAAESAEFLRKATVLAKGGVTDLGTAVDGLTSVLNAYGLSYEETDRVAAAFFSAQKFGKTTVAELSAEIGKVAPVANQLDVTYQELLSTYAILTKQGIRTQESTTAIKNLMVGVLKPTKQAAEVFDKLGIAYGAANVKQAGFGNVLKDVAEAVESGNAEVAQLFPNIRALVGAGALGTRQLKEYDEILQTVNKDWGEGSSLSRAFETQMNELSTTMNRIKEGFKTARFAIGEFFEPLIKGFADAVFPIEKTSEALIRQQANINNLVGAATNLNTSEEVRLDLIKSIQEEYPDFIKNIDAEKVSNEELKTALASTNEEYEKRIRLAVIEELYKDQAEAIAESVQEERNLTRQLEFQEEILRKNADGTLERNAATTAQVNAAIIQTQRLPGLIKKEQDARADLKNEIQETIKLLGDLKLLEEKPKPKPKPKPGGGGGTEGETEDEKKARIKAEIALEKARATLEIDIEKARIAAIEDLEIQAQANETLRYNTRVAELYSILELHPELQKQINEALLAEEELYQANTLEIFRRYETQRTEEQQKQDQERKKSDDAIRDAKIKNAQQYTQMAGQAVQAFSNLFAAAKAKELSAVGDNEEKRLEIEKKYAKKERNIAYIQAIIGTANAVINALQTKPFLPMGPIMAGVAGALGGIQIATIARQKFAEGGKVQPGSEMPGMPTTGDNTLALVKPGEVILNRGQQLQLGGAETFRKIGVPGFASGGIVPAPDTSRLDLPDISSQIIAAMKQIPVVLDMHKVREADERLDIIEQTEGI